MRRAVPGDETLLRELRLQALSDAPEAFGSTLQRELARTKSDWRQWLSRGATFSVDVPQGAGMAAGLPDATDSAVIHLTAMWVHPAIRGSGAAAALVEAVLAWAKSQGAAIVRLNVMQPNHRARRLYERCGFRITGRESVRERDGSIEIQLERLIDRQRPPEADR